MTITHQMWKTTTNRYTLVLGTLVFFGLSSCGDLKKASATRSSAETKCMKDPTLSICNKSVVNVHYLVGNPATVVIKDSKRPTLLAAVDGDLEGLEILMPRGAFEGPLKVTVKSDASLITSLTSIDSLADVGRFIRSMLKLTNSTLPISIYGTKSLTKTATVTIPQSITKSLSQEQLSLLQVKWHNQKGDNKLFGFSDMEVSENQSGKQLRVAFNEWGILTPISDSVAPQFQIVTDFLPTINGGSAYFEFKASEPLQTLKASDIILTNATISSFVNEGLTYKIVVVPVGPGTITFEIPKAKIVDIVGNPVLAGISRSFQYDAVPPTVVISSLSNAITNQNPIPVSISFSESVVGFDISDLVVSGGAITGFSGSGASYAASITPSGDGSITLDLPGSSATDAAGNANSSATQFTRTFDSTAPTVTLTSSEPATTNVSPIPVTATFSESVTGVTLGDFIVVNGTPGNLSGSGSVYTIDVTPSGIGTVTVDFLGGSAVDLAGNGNTAASQLSRNYNNVNPSVVLSTGSGSHTTTAAISVTATFSSSVTGFVAGDVSVSNAVVSSFSGSGTTYTFTLTASGQGAFTANVLAGVAQDVALNSNTASNLLSVVFDSVAPTTTISSAAGTTTNTSPIPITITFSEPVTNFVVSDITVVGGTVGGFSGSGTTYTADITPSGQGSITVDVAGSAAQDLAGNNNTAAPQLTRTFDSQAPTVNITSATSAVTNSSPIPITVTFSESVTGFALGDISASNATVGNLSGSGATYTADVTPTANGSVTVDVAGSVAQDSGGNNNVAATQLSRVFDNSVPAPGNSGTIATSAIQASSLTLTWAAATDNITVPSSLQYEVRRSTSNNLLTVANAELNGTITNAYAANISSANISGLTLGVTYYFTVIVRDMAGNKSVYSTQTATTADNSLPVPGSSGTVTTASVTDTGLTLNWTAASDDVTAGASLQYFVCSGVSLAAIDTVSECESATQVMNWTANTVTRSVTSLSPATTYHYNIIVRDAAGNKEIYSGVSQATSADSTAPTAGTFSASTGVTATGFTLNWSSASDNVTPTASLQYLVCSGASLAAINSVSNCEGSTVEMAYTANVLTRVITGRTPSTTYHYNVVVRDAAGNKSLYDGRSQATAADVTPPTAGTYSGAPATESSVTLSLNTSTDNVTANGSLQYASCRTTTSAADIDTVSECESNVNFGIYITAALSQNFSGLLPSTTYYFNTVVRDQAGNKSIYPGITVTTLADTTAPTPGNSGVITTSFVLSTSINLNWNTGTDDVWNVPSLQYYICRGASAAAIDTVGECEGATQVLNWSANASSFNVTGLSPTTTYYFNVIIRDGSNNKEIYAGVTQATTGDSTPPTAGTFSASTNINASYLDLVWNAATDNLDTSAELYYFVCRGPSALSVSTVNGCETQTMVLDWTQFVLSQRVSELTPSSTYYFNVIVRDSAGNKAIYPGRSDSTVADTSVSAAGIFSESTLVTSSSFTINWTKSVDDITPAASLEYFVCSGASVAAIDTVGECEAATQEMNWTTNQLSHALSSLTSNTYYFFNVLVRDAAGNKRAYIPLSQRTLGSALLDIAAGGNNTCAVSADNSVRCWGANASAQLGYGDTTARETPEATAITISNTSKVVIGLNSACALSTSGDVKCWGSGDNVGYGDGLNRSAPSPANINLGAGRTALSMSAGTGHVCAILDDNSLKCWGPNWYGALGYGDSTNRNAPASTGVSVGAGRYAAHVSAGPMSTCAILDNGDLKCWGYNNSGGNLGYGDTSSRNAPPVSAVVNVGAGRTVTKVAVGSQHTCAILDDGSLKCWGANWGAQLGYGDGTSRSAPESSAISLGAGRTAIDVAVQDNSTCAILDDNSVKCWGTNSVGQLGYGDTTTRYAPAATGIAIGGTPLKLVSSHGGYSFCVSLVGGGLKCWGGMGFTAALGIRNMPVPSQPGEAFDLGVGRTAVAVDTSPAATCVLLDDASVKCWGGGYAPTGTSNAFGGSVKDLQMGFTTGGCAIMSDNSVKCGGSPINLGSGRTAKKLSSGYHTCSILDDDTLKCWGGNFSGQLGYGDTTTRANPEPTTVINVGSGRYATKVSAGEGHTCAILDDKSLKCWGTNSNGQLGYGDTVSRSAPEATTTVNLGAGRTAFDIIAGQDNTCALLDNLTVKCWGSGNKVGYGDSATRNAPATNAINFGSGMSPRSVSKPGDTTQCAVTGFGAAQCFGNSTFGTLGYGPTVTSLSAPSGTPINLGPGEWARQISNGHEHACVVTGKKEVKCWGRNAYTNQTGPRPGLNTSAPQSSPTVP